jgi:hypothetical protein
MPMRVMRLARALPPKEERRISVKFSTSQLAQKLEPVASLGHDCYMTEPLDHPDQSLDDERLERLDQALDEAEEASHRMGRRDWLLFFVGTVLALAITDLVTAGPRSLPYEILAGALAIIGVIVTAIFLVRSRRSSELPDPGESLEQRVKYVSNALTRSARNLNLATRLMADLQAELSSRTVALESLRQEISDNEELAKRSKSGACAAWGGAKD